MKRLPILIVMVIAGVFLAFQTMGKPNTNPPSKYEKILQLVGEILAQGHYSPKDINDEFSKKVYNKYFEELDPDKNIFKQEDLAALSRFSTRIDDEIKGAPVQFFLEVGKIFNKRAEEATAIYKDILSRPFDFTVNESVVTDADKNKFANTDAERTEQWRKRLKYLALQRYVELQEARESNKGKDGFVSKTDAELEKEARDKIRTAMDRTFERYRLKFDDDEKFSIYVNTITQMMDPYTEFMPPVDKRYFDEQLSGSFDGIGAQLTYDEGNIKIASVLPGGPAHKSEQVEVGDVVVRVAQGKDTPVELAGYTVEDAVKIIRGKKGTEVRLTLRKKDGTLKTIALIRDKIVQDETYVRSAVINQGTSKIGYIFLPEFYANFNDPTDPHRSSVDVANEVKKLKAEKVDGIVIDLRNNGGGSLYDVIQIAGLFIDQGPVVQVKGRESQPEVMKDKDGGVLYDGPLAVMVNEFSASASEILAAAIQDYGRGVVIGSTSTYGKGTVQRSFGLDPESNFMNTNSELGSLKLTLQKFYRISGGSTQQKGVVPDVVVPDYYEYLQLREKHNTNSLEYDEIGKANYSLWQPGFSFQTIKNLANARIANDSVFRLIKQETDLLAKQNDKEYPLEINQFRKEQKVTREAVKRIEKLVKLDQAMQISFLKQDQERYVSADKDKTERYKQWLNNVSKDIYVDEAVKIINDMVIQHNIAKGKQATPAKTF
ncbi:MAG TPA: carboxy terminal-processing peptidase [Flavisolibacter sp.]|nr:carboxy terminal-processing peptidase [Flavisolibacter sp.]